jgi:hypothetical protein
VPLVLAIEPDPRQAATLKRVVKGRVRTELVVVDSKDAALASMAARVPDLILVTALLPPRDEDDLTRHLKALDHAGHLQTLTIPMFASAPTEAKLGGRAFGAFRRKKRPAAMDGCNPNAFGAEIEAYLERAAELRDEHRAAEAAQAARVVEREAAAAFANDAEEIAESAQVATALGWDTPCPAPSLVEQYVEQDFSPALAVPSPAIDEAAESTAAQVPSLVEQYVPSLVEQYVPSLVEQYVPSLVEQYVPSLVEPYVEQDFSPALAVPPLAIDQAAESIEAQAPSFVEPYVEQDFSPALAVPPLAIDQAAESTAAQAPSLAEQYVEQDFSPALAAPPPAGEQAAESTAAQAPGLAEQYVEQDFSPALAAPPPAGDARELETAPEPVDIAASGDADGTELAAADASPAADQPDRERTSSRVREASDAVHAAFARALGQLHACVAHVATSLKTRTPAVALDLNADVPATRDVRTDEAIPESTASTGSDLGSVATGGDSGLATPAAPTPAPAPAVSPVETVPERAAEATEAPARAETSEWGGSNEDEWIDITPLITPPDKSRDEGPAAETLEEGTRSDQSGPDSNTPEIAATADAEKEKRRRRRRRRARTAPAIDTAFAGLDGQLLASAIAALRGDIARLREEAQATAPAGSGATSQSAQVRREDALVAQGGNGNGNGIGNGNGHGHVETTQQEPEPVQDEWGFYDPERCGIQALMTRLEARDAAAGNDPANRASQSATRQLMSGDAGPQGTGSNGPPAQVPGPDLKRLAPLAMWARAGEDIECQGERRLPAGSPGQLPRLMAGLRLPEQVAAVRYGSGARIRHVRVAPGPTVSPTAKRQVVILSKKALKDLRDHR